MLKPLRLFVTLVFVCVLLSAVNASAERPTVPPPAGTTKPAEKDAVSFVRDVAPILVKHCQACHGLKQSESNYRIDSFQLLMQPGDFDTSPISPGDLDDSQLFQLIASDDEDLRMPMDGDPLAERRIALIGRWIEQGARFDGPDRQASLESLIPRVPHPQPPEAYPAPIPITALAFDPEGDELLVGGYHELTVWDSRDGTFRRRIGDLAERTYCLAFSPDGSVLAVGGGAPGRSGELVLLDSTYDSRRRLLERASGVVFDVAFAPDGKRLAAASSDRTIRVYELDTGQEQRVIENHADWVTAVAWSRDGSRIASASRDQTAKVFDINTGELVATYSGHAQPVNAAAFSVDGKHVFSAGADKKVHVWNSHDAKKVGEITGYSGDVFKLAVDDELIFSVSADRTARLHSATDRKQLRSFVDHSDWVYCLALDRNAGRLATGCHDGYVRVWDTATGKQMVTFIAAPGYSAADRERP